jgi:alkylated DNA repair protein alkB homolog 1
LPVNVQISLLSRLLHEELSDPRHKTNLHLHYKVPYPEVPGVELRAPDAAPDVLNNRPSFFSYSPLSEVTFIPKDLSIHRPLSIPKVLQKSLRWITLGGQYDWTNKGYPDEEPPAFPPDIGGLLHGLFPSMKPQAAIVNLYSPGDTLSLHRDVSEKSDRGLVSISLGCDCLFVIGNQHPSDGLVIRLRSGDGVFMAEDARFAWHGVPRILPNTCPSALKSWPAESGQFEDWRGWMSNKRINLNVRQMND